jgi:phosphoserine phosphatase RsbU/P
MWLGIWSAMYGAAQLSQLPAVVAVLPHWLQRGAPLANTSMTFLIVVVGSLCFVELSLGGLRLLIQMIAWLGLGLAVAAVVLFVVTGSNERLMLYNQLLATCALLALAFVLTVPGLARKYLVLPDRGVLAIGTLAFALEALYVNLSRPFGFETPRLLDHLGFGILLFSFGYAALQLVLGNERRLLSVQSELAVAREIQTSILPSGVPDIDDLRIVAAYRPMTEVAGDFYEFIPVDQKRVGILVADVSGHGVPAALIASMIKVAVQSVVHCAQDPRAVLLGLNRLLSAQLRGQFVTAAYLWLDTEDHQALYSAAGHPPLVLWRRGQIERIESNGLLFGVKQDGEYPVCSMPIHAGDRFLLYTDGVTEPENSGGNCFGDARLEQVVRDNEKRPPAALSDKLLDEISHWQPDSLTQQDDITLIIVDVV